VNVWGLVDDAQVANWTPVDTRQTYVFS